MFGRCKHQWEEVQRAFNPPRQTTEFQYNTQEQLERILYGITVVELRCSCCGRLDTYSFAGKT